ncbi:MAG TPA: hypothetical protein VGX25_17550 [Actinophytocola sp.]|uniref:hypothetical protein n=1 Tax=Actinophytocola sp. TaxID=1872138 RepID=UPI002DDD6761|nr:hypothetical protein [Actinophytocola sp.]HEV2781190.1 hypothetical protein [Actinophytocola sp.]
MRRWLIVPYVLLVAGCGVDERADTAGQAAEGFVAAVENGDMSAACAMLAPQTRDDLLTEAPDCAEALSSQTLPTSPVGEVAVWGDRAQVHSDAGMLFLAEFDDGWKVVAAGCESRGADLPYRCVVGG